MKVNIKEPVSGNEKFKALGKANVFVFPPNAPEGHPWVIVEAMAAALPIISTNQGAIIESVIDGENGFIVPSQSPNDLASAIKKLILDKELREKMGAMSKTLYEQKFTEGKMVANFTHVFNQLIAKD